MNMKSKILALVRLGNIIEFFGVTFLLVLAMILQFSLHELPCPLCLLQRIGFLGIAFGFLLNIRFGFHSSHYAIVIFSALFTSIVALQHILLHIVPGTGVYGGALLGLHLYTWAFIVAMLIALSSAALLGFEAQYQEDVRDEKSQHGWSNYLFVLMVIILIANIFSAIIPD